MAAMLGALVRAGMIDTPLEGHPGDNPRLDAITARYAYRRFKWSLGWIAVGLVSGIVIGLLFVGAIAKDAGSIARVLAIAIFAGYSAPTLFKQQERVISEIVDERLRKLNK